MARCRGLGPAVARAPTPADARIDSPRSPAGAPSNRSEYSSRWAAVDVTARSIFGPGAPPAVYHSARNSRRRVGARKTIPRPASAGVTCRVPANAGGQAASPGWPPPYMVVGGTSSAALERSSGPIDAGKYHQQDTSTNRVEEELRDKSWADQCLCRSRILCLFAPVGEVARTMGMRASLPTLCGAEGSRRRLSQVWLGGRGWCRATTGVL